MKRAIKKYAFVICIAIILAGCGVESNYFLDTTEKIDTVADTPEKMSSPKETVEAESEDSNNLIMNVVQNEYFSVKLISNEEMEEQYEEFKDDPNIRIVFEITNLTEHTICKNVGEETYEPGSSWERSLYDRQSRWEKGALKDNWVHFNLFDENGEKFFGGGFRFVLDEDLQIRELEIFDDKAQNSETEDFFIAGRYLDKTGRATAEITMAESSGIDIEIYYWPVGSSSRNHWTMQAQFRDDTLIYENCILELLEPDEVGDSIITVEYIDGEGYFKYQDGKLSWLGCAEEEYRNLVFERFDGK